MNKVTRDAVKALLETEDNVTLSLYLPTHRFPTSEHITQDKIRLKNLIKAGKQQLKKQKVDDALLAQITKSIEDDIYSNDSFWQHTTEGAAIFCSPAGVRYFHLPIECEEYVAASDRYDIAPLLAVASCDRPYYLLALAVKHPVLLYGDIYGLERVAIELPESPEKALNIDELFSNSQTARSNGYGAGNPGAKSHGQGDSKQAGQEERLKFFRLIDEKILSSKKINKKVPVLLAGTEDEVSAYRESSRIKQLLRTWVKGNYTDTPLHEVYQLARPMVEQELCAPEKQKELERLHDLLGTGRAALGSREILVAADEGRVDSLLVGMFLATRDSVDDSTREITKIVFSDHYRKEKVDASVRSAFDHGGKVIAVAGSELPEGSYAAAVYRY